MLCSTGQFKCLAFISHYSQLKIISKLSHSKAILKGWDFPCQHTTFSPHLCIFISSVLWCICLMFGYTIPTKAGKSGVPLRNNTKWVSTWNVFPKPLSDLSLSSRTAWCTLHYYKAISFNKLTTALAISSCSYNDFFDLKKNHQYMHSCGASFWFVNLCLWSLLYIHPSQMLQLYGISEFKVLWFLG